MSSAERLLDVLLAVATAPAPQTVKQICDTTGLPTSSAYRLLTLLKKRGFVSDLGREVGYGLGPACLQLAGNFDRTSRVLALALPEMQKLSLSTQESVGLMKAVGTEVLCIEMVESPLSLRCSFSRGRSQPLIRGASAKALLAFLPQEVCNATIERLLKDEDQRRALMDELAVIRRQGFAVSEGEVDAGVWGVSVPVFAPGARLECSISLMAPSVRVGPRAQEFIAQTIKAAQAVTEALSRS